MIFIGIFCVFIGFILLALVYLLPVSPMQKHVRESVNGWLYRGNWPILVDGYNSTQLDTFTDSFMLSIAVFQDEHPFGERVVKNFYAAKDEMLPGDALNAYLQGEECFGQD